MTTKSFVCCSCFKSKKPELIGKAKPNNRFICTACVDRIQDAKRKRENMV